MMDATTNVPRRLGDMASPSLPVKQLSVEAKQPEPLPVTPDTYGKLAQDRSVSNGAFRAWHNLRSYTNKDWECWPSLSTLRRKLGNCSGERLQRWLRELVDNGYVAVIDVGGPRKSSRYRLHGGFPDKRALRDAWCSAYQKHFGSKYDFENAKDGKAAGRLLLKGKSADELISIAEQAWRNLDKFNCAHSITLAGFASRFPNICLEVDPDALRGRQTMNKKEQQA